MNLDEHRLLPVWNKGWQRNTHAAIPQRPPPSGQPCSGASAGSDVAVSYAGHRVPGSATARRRAAGASLNKVL